MPKITLAYPYTGADGKNHRPYTTIDVDDAEAARLLHYGLARAPEPDTKKES